MTSVPKPLKFLRPHYAGLKETFEKCTHAENKKLLADILSLLAMTRAHVPGEIPESLMYRLLGSSEEIGTWGHEVRQCNNPKLPRSPSVAGGPHCVCCSCMRNRAHMSPRLRPGTAGESFERQSSLCSLLRATRAGSIAASLRLPCQL